MKVWVEDTSVEDIKGRVFLRTGGGSASGGQPEDGTASAQGWHGVGSNGKAVVGADLPKRIYVRWQSIVEPQTYKAWVDIPEEARQLMLESVNQRCAKNLNKRGAITRLSTWAWRPVVSCKFGFETHATILSKSPEHRQRWNRWGLVKVRTKGAMRILSVKSPSGISRDSAFRTGVGRRQQEDFSCLSLCRVIAASTG